MTSTPPPGDGSSSDVGPMNDQSSVSPPPDGATSVDAPTGTADAEPTEDASGPPPMDAAPLADASPPPADGKSPADASPPPADGKSPADASPPPVDAAPQDTGPVDMGTPPPPDDGGGCSAGSLVITATDPEGPIDSGTVGNFGTTGAVCVKLMGGIVSQYGGWNSSNTDGRTVTLNGATVPVGGAQGAVPPGPNGYAIWEWTAGTRSYASMSLY